MHVIAQMEKEKLSKEDERTQKSMRCGTESPALQGRQADGNRTHTVQNKRTLEEGRHELWAFYRNGIRKEYLFTPNGLIEAQKNDRETKEKKEKTSCKISLNEVLHPLLTLFIYQTTDGKDNLLDVRPQSQHYVTKLH